MRRIWRPLSPGGRPGEAGCSAWAGGGCRRWRSHAAEYRRVPWTFAVCRISRSSEMTTRRRGVAWCWIACRIAASAEGVAKTVRTDPVATGASPWTVGSALSKKTVICDTGIGHRTRTSAVSNWCRAWANGSEAHTGCRMMILYPSISAGSPRLGASAAITSARVCAGLRVTVPSFPASRQIRAAGPDGNSVGKAPGRSESRTRPRLLERRMT